MRGAALRPAPKPSHPHPSPLTPRPQVRGAALWLRIAGGGRLIVNALRDAHAACASLTTLLKASRGVRYTRRVMGIVEEDKARLETLALALALTLTPSLSPSLSP